MTDVRSLLARLGALAWLTLVWVLLWGHATAGTILAGVAVGIAVLVLLPLPRVPVEGRVRPLSVLWLVIRFSGYLIQSSLQVAWISVRPRPLPTPAVLRVPTRVRSDYVLALLVDALNLIPGGIVLEIDHPGNQIYIHVLDAGSDAAVRAFERQTSTIERLFIRAFARDEDWRPSSLHAEAYSKEES